MSPLADLAGDSAAIGRMTDAEFTEYWTALGTVVRLVCKARPPPAGSTGPPGQDPTSVTSATIERAPQWDHDKRPPATAFGFTRHPGRTTP